MEKYLQNGEEIFRTYCLSTDETPVMFPRAPEQTYIDLYPNDDPKGLNFKTDMLRQSNYEAEVKLYRALEKLDKKLIVLHNFEYTHHQYRLCNKLHVRKGCPKCKGKNAANKEGECDFLLIGNNYIVVIEVKDMTHLGIEVEQEQEHETSTDQQGQLRALNGTFRKSLEQRKRMEELIHYIDEEMMVLHFTAYPNFSKQFQKEFQLTDAEISSVIFE